MASIEFDDVTKRYADGVVAVRDLSVVIPDGEFMIFVGPSGCGKTTALRMVAGLEEITSGTVRLSGREINDVDPSARDIAMVFQNYALYPHMTVAANIGFPLRMRREPKDKIRSQVGDVARLLGIESLLMKKPRELSGGQRQRVAMGRAIIRHPQAFLMDEPLSNLDAKLRIQMRAELIKIHRTLGVTTIYVTHDQTEAMTLGQRVTVMNEGIVQQVAAPVDLYNWPANLFVASFIGSPPMNFVRGTIDGLSLSLGHVAIALPDASAARSGGPGADVTVGLRPESFRISSSAGDGDASNRTISARVEVVEQLGSEAYVYFRAAGLDVLEVGERPGQLQGMLCARLEAGIQCQAGDLMALEINTDLLRLFDQDTGRALLTAPTG